MVVIRIGRKRSIEAWKMESRVFRPSLRSAFNAKAIQDQIMAGVVIENRVVPILRRMTCERDDAPVVDLVVRPDRIVGLADIWTVAHRDEPLLIEAELLPADAHLQNAVADSADMGDEGLLKVQPVRIGGAGIELVRRFVIFELDESLPTIPPEIAVNLHAVEQIAVAFLAGDAEQRRVQTLDSLPNIGSEGEVYLAVIGREWDVFQRIERFGSKGGVCQNRPVLTPSFSENGRSHGVDRKSCCRIRCCCLRHRNIATRQQRPDDRSAGFASDHFTRAWISAM